MGGPETLRSHIADASSCDSSGLVSAYVFDFTAAAEGLGWVRIPAKRGWMYEPTIKEFWHYQMREDNGFRPKSGPQKKRSSQKRELIEIGKVKDM